MIIKAARPNISDNSIKQYMSSLRTLNGGSAVPINNVDFLKDFDVVMEKLKEKKPTTIKNYMNAIIVVLGALKMDDVLIKQYEAVRDKLNGQYSEEQATISSLVSLSLFAAVSLSSSFFSFSSLFSSSTLYLSPFLFFLRFLMLRVNRWAKSSHTNIDFWKSSTEIKIPNSD